MVLKMKINHTLLKLAQIKARIARKNGDGAKWMEANEEMKAAAGMPWYRGNSNRSGDEYAEV
ncbi:TPA: host cell division inhibitory peptide Kil [Klebsiella aerogenes]|nr:host cell division inhibitory peptide Kil [Klebsiella aerogenes]